MKKSIKIETKLTILLVAVAGFSLLLCIVAGYFAIRPGLRDLFAHMELQKVAPWARGLEIVYDLDGGWDGLAGKEKELFPDSRALGADSLENRIRLFDREGKLILGDDGELNKGLSVPLTHQKQIIGYLSVQAPTEGYLDEQFARHYLRSQAKALAVVSLLILGLSLLLARLSPNTF